MTRRESDTGGEQPKKTAVTAPAAEIKPESAKPAATESAGPPSPKPWLARFEVSAAQATIVAALFAVLGAGLGHVISSLTTRDTAALNASAQLAQQAERLKHEIAQQNEKQRHEITLERQKFVQETITTAIARGTEEEQRRTLRFYATIGIIDEPYARKILELPENQLPVAAPPRGSIAPFAGKLFSSGGDMAMLPAVGATITEHRVVGDGKLPVIFSPSDFRGDRFPGAGPSFIVVDFASGDTVAGFTQAMKLATGSVHVVIDRDGGIVQYVPFDTIAYHAGASKWGGVTGLNQHSIGIEFINNGQLRRAEDGNWLTFAGATVPAGRVCIERPSGEREQGWECYSEAQIATAAMLVKALKQAYPSLREVVSQAEISPGRKLGPGPAFPLAELKRQL